VQAPPVYNHRVQRYEHLECEPLPMPVCEMPPPMPVCCECPPPMPVCEMPMSYCCEPQYGYF
jgi:hypothetical protein